MRAVEIASVCHEANRAIQQLTGEEVSPAWDDAPEWMQASAVEVVQKALENAGPRELHQHWVDARLRDGWQYGPVKDEQAKTHPCLVDYEMLPDIQRAKDRVFMGIVRALKGTPR